MYPYFPANAVHDLIAGSCIRFVSLAGIALVLCNITRIGLRQVRNRARTLLEMSFSFVCVFGVERVKLTLSSIPRGPLLGPNHELHLSSLNHVYKYACSIAKANPETPPDPNIK